MSGIDGINGKNGIDGIKNLQGTTPTGKTSEVKDKTGLFGFGFGGDALSVSSGFERTVPGLNALSDKFAFETPKYTKNIGNLEISDKDYIPDGTFDESPFCEV